MSLLRLCHWLGRTHLGLFMRNSTYAFAVVEIGHLLALAVFGGAIRWLICASGVWCSRCNLYRKWRESCFR